MAPAPVPSVLQPFQDDVYLHPSAHCRWVVGHHDKESFPVRQQVIVLCGNIQVITFKKDSFGSNCDALTGVISTLINSFNEEESRD